ncbi:MAG TPA: redoxin domain-containing protein [Candidatus Eremiobacteraceae bacterium]|nr:redoxin domain-containing protein [Candidatus Eremiobacteraceae bacterium]
MLASVVAALALLSCAAHAATTSSSATLDRALTASDWLNGKPTPADVRGKVVVLDFYTFECYNCKNVEPNLRALYKEVPRKDLVILSVHSPETAFEHSRKALIASFDEQGVVWPVAVDNDFAIWNSYGINAWPTQLIFDRRGALRKTVVGDSQDQVVNATVKQLIAERG